MSVFLSAALVFAPLLLLAFPFAYAAAGMIRRREPKDIAMSTTLQGTRVWPDEHGWLDDKAMSKPGAYGRATNPRVQNSAAGDWQVTTPDGHVGRLSPAMHTVVEHEDGTITVSPSIDMSKRTPGAYHGWLRAGIWTSV